MRYFAYGSNMNWEQMKQRCPSALFLGVGRLKDHRLAITRKSRRRLCGTADVIEEPGSVVWGIVYEIEAAELLVLDGFEDGYRRESMNISVSGQEATAWVYIAEKELCPPPPSAHYKRLMLEGARHWRLPTDYIAYLEQIEAVED
jgi:gamma-glutamylcyclotransferase